ncbi:hypothetical protein [Mycobacteroides abscessus]|uniref:Uncharacterized protein n=1 Tax=Mycobacteroides abscessus subsp. massiliense TaxID=1962118 RepID=A0A1U1BK30_9MYCO|nr:hypothetical protein [Mycobacteroides abscessus]SKM81308.1 Uncharacterised protein [Mycobacteroides abscessus subsp. massiliense]SKT63596.1 Uncharacterised protein [Mycobacteroides abscessus subsp. massiliense]SKT91392.1 Uncharacterised protein [Mycobacteroides abscessus subsp. massiliense]SKX37877.1 Uncharacterised protein [Mycobacteroides abscessus subsp. massiliense]
MRHEDSDNSGTPGVGRSADHHMWEVYGLYSARAQAFRDESGRALALITVRDGDRVISRSSEASAFRKCAWMDFFPRDHEPPTLIFNVLNPRLRFNGNSSIGTVEFYPGSEVFRRIQDTDPADVELLNRLGAEWDEGSGFIPYVPPPRSHVLILRRIPVSELPASNIYEDMEPFMKADWAEAVAIALRAGRREDLPEGLPRVLADAAGCLYYDPMGLIRLPGEEVRWMNGQHRGEAMRRQGVVETLVQETRTIGAPPLPGDIQRII